MSNEEQDLDDWLNALTGQHRSLDDSSAARQGHRLREAITARSLGTTDEVRLRRLRKRVLESLPAKPASPRWRLAGIAVSLAGAAVAGFVFLWVLGPTKWDSSPSGSAALTENDQVFRPGGNLLSGETLVSELQRQPSIKIVQRRVSEREMELLFELSASQLQGISPQIRQAYRLQQGKNRVLAAR